MEGTAWARATFGPLCTIPATEGTDSPEDTAYTCVLKPYFKNGTKKLR